MHGAANTGVYAHDQTHGLKNSENDRQAERYDIYGQIFQSRTYPQSSPKVGRQKQRQFLLFRAQKLRSTPKQAILPWQGGVAGRQQGLHVYFSY